MILHAPSVEPAALEAGTGWHLEARGACKGEVCVPLPASATAPDGTLDAAVLADRLGMALVHDADHGVWALGPETAITGRALTTAVAPDIVLPDLRTGEAFSLASLRGQKVLLVAWASW